MSDVMDIEIRNALSSLSKKIVELNETLESFQADMDLATTNSLLTSLQAIIADIATIEAEITDATTAIEACQVQLEKLNFNGDNLKTEYV
jgi:uncharacterized protein YoxC